jgi:hypothetical protein
VRDVAAVLAGNNRHMGRMGRTGLIEDRYRLVERLGTGGMSVVWRGYDEVLARPVAVKVLSPQLAADRTFRDRLRQEALAAARLGHPHITGIFDFGESPMSEHLTVPYVVMELIDGESVSARLRRQGPMPWRDAVATAAEVASALATAHARGVVHRDITPANVRLTPAGAKVVDFGISALVGQRDAAPDGSLLGTPAYLAPERLAGGAVLPATDVYALGLLLYRCLTARLPWSAANTTEALRAHLYADPAPLPSLPGLPTEVTDLCLRCLAKNPDDRPAAADVANALAGLAGRQPIMPPAPVRDTEPLVRAAAPPPQPGRRLTRSLIAYLGLPARTAEPAAGRVRRLRTALRIGSALHIGGVTPLGGCVFVGGRLARDVLTLRSVVAGKHRLPAAVATVTLLAVIGLTWSSARAPADVAPAQAAAAGAGPAGVLRVVDCRVRYQVKRDSGRDFEAELRVSNLGDHPLRGWRLTFTYPGTQRVTWAPRRVSQNGRHVVVRGTSGGKLDAGRSLSVPLRGLYQDANPMPTTFALNGHDCESVLLGATTTDAGDSAEVEAAGR